jgi:hypothetical protein
MRVLMAQPLADSSRPDACSSYPSSSEKIIHAPGGGEDGHGDVVRGRLDHIRDRGAEGPTRAATAKDRGRPPTRRWCDGLLGARSVARARRNPVRRLVVLADMCLTGPRMCGFKVVGTRRCAASGSCWRAHGLRRRPEGPTEPIAAITANVHNLDRAPRVCAQQRPFETTDESVMDDEASGMSWDRSDPNVLVAAGLWSVTGPGRIPPMMVLLGRRHDRCWSFGRPRTGAHHELLDWRLKPARPGTGNGPLRSTTVPVHAAGSSPVHAGRPGA